MSCDSPLSDYVKCLYYHFKVVPGELFLETNGKHSSSSENSRSLSIPRMAYNGNFEVFEAKLVDNGDPRDIYDISRDGGRYK